MPLNGSMSETRPSKPVDLAIVGGGISGLVLLLGILKHTDASQVRPHVYEAHSTSAAIGAGLSFLPNTIRAAELLDPRIHDGYWKLALPPSAGPPKNGKEFLFAFGCDSKDGGESFKAFDIFLRNDVRVTGGPGVPRAAFLSLLVDLVEQAGKDDTRGQGPYISYSKRLLDVTECDGPDGGVDLHFADEAVAHADAVIGSEGIKSTTREAMLTASGELDAIPPVYSGGYAYRGFIPLTKNETTLQPELVQNLVFQAGYGGQVFTYPIQNGELLNVIVTHHTEGSRWEHEKWIIPATRDDMSRDFQVFGKPTQTIIANLERIDAWALFESQPCKQFYRKGKICLLGDSAHAGTPHQGIGAGMCIEDAVVLSKLLARTSKGDGNELERVFAAYDAVRRPRSMKAVKTSHEMALLSHMNEEGTLDDPEKIKQRFQTRFDWLWHADLTKDVDEAVELFKSSG